MVHKKEQPAIIFPFTSDKFMDTWEMWKNYKKDTFGFVYKGVYSEQMTLRKLTELSGGEEEKAIRIIEQSVMQQWQGLFPLHIPSIKPDGSTKTTRKTNGKSGEQDSLRERVQAELNRRNGGGQPAAGRNGSTGV